MKLVFGLFLCSFLLGQIGVIAVSPSIRISFLDISVGILMLYSLFGKERNRIPKLWIPILLFFISSLFSIFFSEYAFDVKIVGILYSLRWLYYALLYWVFSMKMYSPLLTLKTIFYAIVGIAAIGIVQFFLYPDLRNLFYLGWDPHYYRLASTMIDPNFAGIILVFGFFAGLFLLSQQKRYWRLYAFFELIIAIAVFMTFSRSALLAFFAGIGVWAWFHSVYRKMGYILLVVLFGVFVIGLVNKGEGQNLIRSVSSYARFDSFQKGIEIAAWHPILGVGFAGVRQEAIKYGWIKESEFIVRSQNTIDTGIVYILASTGVIGLSIYIWMYWMIIRFALHVIYEKANRYYGLLLLSITVSMLVHSMFTQSLLYPWVVAIFWVVFGLTEQTTRKIGRGVQ